MIIPGIKIDAWFIELGNISLLEMWLFMFNSDHIVRDQRRKKLIHFASEFAENFSERNKQNLCAIGKVSIKVSRTKKKRQKVLFRSYCWISS